MQSELVIYIRAMTTQFKIPESNQTQLNSTQFNTLQSMSFPYKHILVIGATAGIGRALASRLVQSGAKVTAVGRRKERLDEFVQEHGEDKTNAVQFDISDLDRIPEFAAE